MNGKNCYDQSTDSDIKQDKEITKWTTGHGEDYTTRCLLDCKYIKSHYRRMVVDLSRYKELDADLKAIQQIEFIKYSKNQNNQIVDNQSMFVLTILQKFKETIVTFLQESVTVS